MSTRVCTLSVDSTGRVAVTISVQALTINVQAAASQGRPAPPSIASFINLGTSIEELRLPREEIDLPTLSAPAADVLFLDSFVHSHIPSRAVWEASRRLPMATRLALEESFSSAARSHASAASAPAAAAAASSSSSSGSGAAAADPKRQLRRCAVCFDRRVAVTARGVSCGMGCGRGAFVCAACLPCLVQPAAERSMTELTADELRANEYRVLCPCDCGEHYPAAPLFAALSRRFPRAPQLEAASRLAAETLRAAQRALDEARQGEMDPKQFELLCVRASFRKADGSYAAYMCRRCGFGPIDHKACSDLAAHHHEARWVGWRRARTSNACPKCGWFASHIAQWPAWDGHTLGPTRLRAHHQLTRAASRASLSAETKRRTKVALGIAALAPVAIAAAPFVAVGYVGRKGLQAWRREKRRRARATRGRHMRPGDRAPFDWGDNQRERARRGDGALARLRRSRSPPRLRARPAAVPFARHQRGHPRGGALAERLVRRRAEWRAERDFQRDLARAVALSRLDAARPARDGAAAAAARAATELRAHNDEAPTEEEAPTDEEEQRVEMDLREALDALEEELWRVEGEMAWAAQRAGEARRGRRGAGGGGAAVRRVPAEVRASQSEWLARVLAEGDDDDDEEEAEEHEDEAAREVAEEERREEDEEGEEEDEAAVRALEEVFLDEEDDEEEEAAEAAAAAAADVGDDEEAVADYVDESDDPDEWVPRGARSRGRGIDPFFLL